MGLPDEEGRREIFEIHTGLMAASGMLGPDVNLRELAANTTSFNGAEIAGVVRAAASFALERYVSHLCCGQHWFDWGVANEELLMNAGVG